jgi:lipopolysaccharide biosynthesis regulator YciM
VEECYEFCPQPSLEAGPAALKQGDYRNAIAHLEAVCQNQPTHSSQVKAQIGLVKAYCSTGEISRAIALCQNFNRVPILKLENGLVAPLKLCRIVIHLLRLVWRYQKPT